jgi:hypothetical protein
MRPECRLAAGASDKNLCGSSHRCCVHGISSPQARPRAYLPLATAQRSLACQEGDLPSERVVSVVATLETRLLGPPQGALSSLTGSGHPPPRGLRPEPLLRRVPRKRSACPRHAIKACALQEPRRRSGNAPRRQSRHGGATDPVLSLAAITEAARGLAHTAGSRRPPTAASDCRQPRSRTAERPRPSC